MVIRSHQSKQDRQCIGHQKKRTIKDLQNIAWISEQFSYMLPRTINVLIVSVLYWANTLSWNVIVLSYCNISPQINYFVYSDTIYSLFSLLHVLFVAEEQAIPMYALPYWPDQGLKTWYTHGVDIYVMFALSYNYFVNISCNFIFVANISLNKRYKISKR